MQECGNAFIGQLAVQIAIQAENDKVKTVGETQVVNALKALGFDEMCEEVLHVCACVFIFLNFF